MLTKLFIIFLIGFALSLSNNSYSEILFEKKVIFDKSSISDLYKINNIDIYNVNEVFWIYSIYDPSSYTKDVKYPVILKTDLQFNNIWERQFRINDRIEPYNVIKKDNNIILLTNFVRYSLMGEARDYTPMLMKLDKDGNLTEKLFDTMSTKNLPNEFLCKPILENDRLTSFGTFLNKFYVKTFDSNSKMVSYFLLDSSSNIKKSVVNENFILNNSDYLVKLSFIPTLDYEKNTYIIYDKYYNELKRIEQLDSFNMKNINTVINNDNSLFTFLSTKIIKSIKDTIGNYMILKSYNFDGNLLADKFLPIRGNLNPYQLIEVYDGFIIGAIEKTDGNFNKHTLIKLDKNLNIVTEKSYGSEDSITYSSTKIKVVEDKVLLFSQLINLHKDSLYYRKYLYFLALKNDFTDIQNRNEVGINFIVTPNPASDYIVINLSSSPSIKRGQGGVLFEIYNIFGEKIPPRHFAMQNATPQDGNIKIDISNLVPGVYFIKIGNQFEKFIKI